MHIVIDKKIAPNKLEAKRIWDKSKIGSKKRMINIVKAMKYTNLTAMFAILTKKCIVSYVIGAQKKDIDMLKRIPRYRDVIDFDIVKVSRENDLLIKGEI